MHIPFNIKKTMVFLIQWLFLGFALGTVLLLFPIRWIIEYAAKNGWAKQTQDLTVILMMVLLAIVSLLMALYLTKKSMMSLKRLWLFGIMSMVFFAGSLLLWLNPKLINIPFSKANDQALHAQSCEFIFGTYPDEIQMQQLKEDSVTAIISLLHPAVVPFEPVLIHEEEEHAKDLGLQFIHLPMLPWVSDNRTALDSLKRIAKTGNGKYYVHCYLGKDRVNLAKKAIMEVSVSAIKKDHTTMRHLSDISRFERGPIIRIDSGLYVIPYPTDEEYLGYILSSDIRSVVSLLNPQNPENILWIEKESTLLKNYPIRYALLPLSVSDCSSKKLNAMVDSILSMPRPTVIHAFLVPSPESDLIIKGLKRGH